METVNWNKLHELLPTFEKQVAKHLGLPQQQITAMWEGKEDGVGVIRIEIRA